MKILKIKEENHKYFLEKFSGYLLPNWTNAINDTAMNIIEFPAKVTSAEGNIRMNRYLNRITGFIMT